MSQSPVVPEDPEKAWTLITTRREYAEAVKRAIDEVRETLRIFDADCEQLELNAPARIEALGRFLRASPTHRLLIAVHRTDHLERACPRMLGLLRLFSDRIAIRRTEGDALRAQDCFVIADDRIVARRPVQPQPRGAVIIEDLAEIAAMRERFDQIWESAVPAMSATVLGL